MTVTLETAKKLKEAGFPQETIWKWAKIPTPKGWNLFTLDTVVSWGEQETFKDWLVNNTDYLAAPPQPTNCWRGCRPGMVFTKSLTEVGFAIQEIGVTQTNIQ